MNHTDPQAQQERRKIIPTGHAVHLPMEEIPDNDEDLQTSLNEENDVSFLKFFLNTSGPPQVVILCLILALAFGSTVGVVPAVMIDRCARLYHGFDGADCASFSMEEKPDECTRGSQNAQDLSATTSLVLNMLTFATSAVVGSISDAKGRKGVFLIGIFFSLLAPLALVMIQLVPLMDPKWYYAGNSLSGLVNWIAVAISSLSDVMPPKWRAPSFGLLLAGFSCGFAISPFLALTMSHLGVSILSLMILVGGFMFAVFAMPETLPKEVAMEVTRLRAEERDGEHRKNPIIRGLLLPIKELSILNRDTLFRLLASLAFFSGMVSAADQTLLLYYFQERYQFNDNDVAIMFVLIGFLGIFVQGVVLKPLNDCIGEKFVLITAFSLSALTNCMYGLANSKTLIFVALALSSFGGMSFPTISAIKSNNVDELEQGRVQGALYSITALAAAVGPLTLRYIYSQTKDNSIFGPGAMFIFAAFLYVIAIFLAFSLPREKTDSRGLSKEATPSAVSSLSDFDQLLLVD